MCTGSIHEVHRVAKAGVPEKLTVHSLSNYGIACLRDAAGMMVCLRGRQEVTIKSMPKSLLEAGIPVRGFVRNVKATFVARSYADCFEIGDKTILLKALPVFTRIDYCVPAVKPRVRKISKKGVDALNASIREALATTPDELPSKLAEVK